MADFASRLRFLRKDRHMRQVDLAKSLGLAQTTIANYEKNYRSPDTDTLLMIADFFSVSLDYLVGRSDNRVDNKRIYIGAEQSIAVPPIDAYQDSFTPEAIKFVKAVLSGEKEKAIDQIIDLVLNGVSIKLIYTNILERALKEIGRLWEINEIDVASEHYFTSVTESVIGAIHPYLRRESLPKKDLTIALLTAHGEAHNIGIRMLGDFMELEGWTTVYLGSYIPTDDVINALKRHNADILAISATLAYNINSVKLLIDAVRSAKIKRNIKIMVGGQAFNLDSELWTRVGADGYALNPGDAVNIAMSLINKDG